MRVTTVAVSSTAALVHKASYGVSNGKQDVLVYNDSANTVYVGGHSTVTTSDGIPIAASGSLSIPFLLGEELWAIMGAALTGTLRLLIQGE